MPTFLPFLRAVKARARSVALWALITGCAARVTPLAAPSDAKTSPTGPRPIPTLTAAPEPPESALVRSGGAPPAKSPSTLGDSSLPVAPEIQIEHPYPIDARPRAESPLQQAVDDEELARWNVGGSADPNSRANQGSFHPGTRVVVDTRLAKRKAGAAPRPAPRGLTLERVQAHTRARGYWPFRGCFEAGQRDQPGAGGETRVAFTIGTRGRVRAARLLDSALENPKTAACLVREVLKLRFAPAPTRALAMVASIRVWPGDAALPTLAASGAEIASAGGAFDADAVRNLVIEKQAELNGCFAAARHSDPTLWGRLALTVILEVDGSVHRVSEVESHFPSADAARCAEALLSTLRFPSVANKPFSFVIPMRLSPSVTPEADSEPTSDPARQDANRD